VQYTETEEYVYKMRQRLLLEGRNRTALTASSNTSFKFSPVFAEHSKYFNALILLANSSPWTFCKILNKYQYHHKDEQQKERREREREIVRHFSS
jgi:hypothetical protein